MVGAWLEASRMWLPVALHCNVWVGTNKHQPEWWFSKIQEHTEPPPPPSLTEPLGFPGGSDGKESACIAGDPGSIPGLGRSPGEENGNLFQYYWLENFMDGGAWWATVHGVSKSWTWLTLSLSQINTVQRWVWVSSRSWWWTGKPGVLQSMGLQRVGYDWVTELNWTESDGSQDSRRTLSLPTPSLTETLGQALKTAQGAKPLSVYSLGPQGLA